MSAQQDSGWLLHSRPFRDTSAIVELLTHQHGRVAAVVRGVNGGGKAASGKRAALQPFIPLHVIWQGKSALKTLTQFDAGRAVSLRGRHLYAGLYVNELLQRSLPENEPCDAITIQYGAVLEQLAANEALEPVLRRFEINLLQELGYALNLVCDSKTGQPIRDNAWYQMDAEGGLFETDASSGGKQALAGRYLQLLASDQFDETTLPTAKRLCRQALAPILGNKPLRSRELFAKLMVKVKT